jgi:hypothetical protein
MTNLEIKKAYQSIYPNLESHYTILMSEKFLLPTYQEVVGAVKRHSVKGMKYVPNIADCEKFAWYLVWGIQKERSDQAEISKMTWALGWITGFRIDLLGQESHTMVTAMTSDKGIIIIDPMTDAIMEPDIQTFNALLLVA